MINAIASGMVPGDPNVDNTPLFNAMLAGLGATRQVELPAGAYYFNTPPAPIAVPGLKLDGGGINGASFIRNYNAGSLTEPFLRFKNTVTLQNLAIRAGANTSGGCAVLLDGLSCSASKLSNLYITETSAGTVGKYTGMWGITFILDGGDPVLNTLGIRDCVLEHLDLFASAEQTLWCKNVHGLSANYVQCFDAGGNHSRAVFQNSCWNVVFLSHFLLDVWLYDCHNFTFLDVGGTTYHADPACTNVCVVPRVTL